MNSPSIEPVSVLENPAQGTALKWYAIYTKSRHEKLVAREFEKKGIEYFLPLRKIQRQWSDRKKTVEEPLFKGYLFVHIPWGKRVNVLSAVGVVHFVGHQADKAVEILEKELWAVRKFVEEDIPVDPFPYLKTGERVYIRSGPFKGVEGFIVRKDRHCRLVISLDQLMQSVSVEVDEASVEPA